MSTDISQAELTLLQYLHERSGVRGGRIGLDPKPIRRDLGLSESRLAEDSASLVAHGLAGVRHVRTGPEELPSSVCCAIWVTSKGEDYLKRSSRRERAANK
jgi:hypothetical protein